jgi:predicted MFS family arabinose efflux permease
LYAWSVVALLPVGVASPLLTGGLSRVIREIAGEEQLPRANTVDAVTMNAAQLSGPGAAAAAAAILGASAAVLINATLAVVAAAALWMFARGLRAASHDEHALPSRLAGLVLIAKDRRLLGATIASVAGYGASGALPIILPHYVRLLGRPSYAGGTLLTAFAIASLIGTLGTPLLQRRWGALAVVLVGEGVTGALMLTWPLATTFGLLVVLVTAAGVADGPGLTAMLGVRQQRAPRSAYGRVVTAGVSLKVGAFALVAAITPAGISVFGVRGCLVCCAALQVVGVAAAAAVIAPRRNLSENRTAAREG